MNKKGMINIAPFIAAYLEFIGTLVFFSLLDVQFSVQYKDN